MRKLIFAISLLVSPGCLDDHGRPVARSFALDVTYDVYCAKKHTAQDAVAVGLKNGCTSVAAPDAPLGMITLPDTKPYPGDVAEGLLCDNCAAIERALQAIADNPDMAEPPKMAPPPPALAAECHTTDTGELWCVDGKNLVPWKLVGGAMVQQQAAPADWPVK